MSAHDVEDLALPLWLRWGFWICVVIAIAVVLRRIFALAYPARSGPSQLRMLDALFVSHAVLTLAHILPALAFVLLCPLLLVRTPGRDPWLAMLLLPLGAVVGITAYAMSVYAVGGWTERSAVLFFNSLFLFSLVRSFLYWKSCNWLLEQRWMMRAVVVLLGIATTRPVMGIFFATSHLTHLEPRQFFGIAFWIGFSLNTVAVELWLRSGQDHHESKGAVHIVRGAPHQSGPDNL